MKKTLLLCGSLLMAVALILVSCKKDEEVNPTVNKYFSVENATLVKKNMPEPTSDAEISMSMNTSAIPGGSSIVSIQSERTAKKILVGMKDQSGYYEMVPDARGAYSFVVMVNQDIPMEGENPSFVVQVAIEDENGAVSKICESSIHLIVVGTGTLQVSLSFDNAKDVDLHLIEPEHNGSDGEPVSFSNRHIYYYNSIVESGGELDLDSNPSCDIDNINNENITYSENAFVPAGLYKVYVDLFENCDPSIATNYVVTVFYGGTLIARQAGVFPVDAPSTYNPIEEDYVAQHEPFLTFSIADHGQKCTQTFSPVAVSESAKEKEANAVHQ